WRPRTVIYTGILVLLVGGLTLLLAHRQPIELTILRAADSPYQLPSNSPDLVVNHLKMHLQNQTFKRVDAKLVTLDTAPGVEVVNPFSNLKLGGGEMQR